MEAAHSFREGSNDPHYIPFAGSFGKEDPSPSQRTKKTIGQDARIRCTSVMLVQAFCKNFTSSKRAQSSILHTITGGSCLPGPAGSPGCSSAGALTQSHVDLRPFAQSRLAGTDVNVNQNDTGGSCLSSEPQYTYGSSRDCSDSTVCEKTIFSTTRKSDTIFGLVRRDTCNKSLHSVNAQRGIASA